MKAHILSQKSATRRNLLVALVIALVVAAVGYALISGRAAGPYASIKAEQTTVNGPAKLVDDSVAGKAIQFQAAPASTPGPGARLFTGDFETGNFKQWFWLDTVAGGANGGVSGSSYNNAHYSLRAQNNVKRQGNFAARFELRDGDIPFSNTERVEVNGGDAASARTGQERWYQFSTMFDAQFPDNHASQGWGVTDQWHHNSGTGSPPIEMALNCANGQWCLKVNRSSSPGVFLTSDNIWQTPLAKGSWHDMKFHILWSPSDNIGFIELWHNGVKQTFQGRCVGQQKCMIRTDIPGAEGNYFKQGIYRCACVNGTAVIYHDSFMMATEESGLGGF